MVLKGLSDNYKALVAVTTQAENVDDFIKFKTSLKHFEETENSRNQSFSEHTSIMKTDARDGKPSYAIPVTLQVTNRQIVTKRKVDGVVFARINLTTPINVES